MCHDLHVDTKLLGSASVNEVASVFASRNAFPHSGEKPFSYGVCGQLGHWIAAHLRSSKPFIVM